MTKAFGPKIAVEGLDLWVKRGEFFCFLGPNGAGKTTTIKLLTGLLRPTSGTALIDGYDIQRDYLKAKAIMGYIPDQPYLYEKLTGHEFLQFAAGLYHLDGKETHRRCNELLEMFEIQEVADQLIEDYSHGMKQKLIFCATFLHEPRLVIIDEPWVGLDPKSIRFIKDYLRAKAQEGLTIFMSTHTLSIAEEVADRVGIIHQGRLIACGSVDEVKASQNSSSSLEEVFLELTEEGKGPLLREREGHIMKDSRR